MPDQAVAERPMTRLIDRVQAALTTGAPAPCLPGVEGTATDPADQTGGAISAAVAPYTPGLSNCAMLLTAPGSYVARACYSRLDDTELRRSEQSDAEFTEAQASCDREGVADSYVLQIGIPAPTLGGEDGLVFYTTRVELTGALEDVEASRRADTDQPLVCFEYDTVAFGDESATYVYQTDGGESTTTTLVLIGDMRFVTRISSATGSLPDVVEPLATAQYTCMVGGTCSIPLPAPRGLLAAAPVSWPQA